jgi:hypothetical protein
MCAAISSLSGATIVAATFPPGGCSSICALQARGVSRHYAIVMTMWPFPFITTGNMSLALQLKLLQNK